MSKEKRILYLTIGRVPFAEIASGRKTAEYRKVKPHWIKRIWDEKRWKIRQFDEIHFRNGYRKASPFMRVECRGVELTWWHKHGETHYVIYLGKILEIRNWNP